MIQVIHGDALSHPQGIIVHGCNCEGHMGGGIAAQVARRFPTAFTDYAFTHAQQGLFIGQVVFSEVAPFKIIANAMTQVYSGNYHPKRNRAVEYDAIEDCFVKVVEHAEQIAADNDGRRLPIVFPQIGAGIAGGNWEIIEKIIDATVPDTFEKILYMYQPSPSVAERAF